MKKYNKHFLERDPSSQVVLVDDGQPVLGKVAKKDCPLEDWQVKTLNKSWKNTGVYYAPMPEEVKEPSDEEKAKAYRADLFQKAKKLVEDGKLEKMPAKNTTTENLEQLIK